MQAFSVYVDTLFVGTGSYFITIIILQKPAPKALKDYEKQKKAGKDPVFDPVALGIKDADFWEFEYGKENIAEEKA